MSFLGYTQAGRALRIATPLGDDTLLLRSITGSEGLSQLFRFQLDLLSEDDSIALPDLVGKPVSVYLQRQDGETCWHGHISRLSQGARADRFSQYRAEMVPWLWFLTRTADCRIFQQKTVPEIIQQIFSDLGFQDYSLRLHGSFRKWEYCVQYRETDFNFVSRLMEEEGIYYYFEYAPDGSKHTLVLANSTAAHDPCPHQERAYCETSSAGVATTDNISSLSIEHEFRPSAWAHTDFNFQTPSANLMVQLEEQPGYEIYDYPGSFGNLGDGDTLARARLQETIAFSNRASGASTCRSFRPGYIVEVADHYRADVNQKWLLTRLQHQCSMGGAYEGGGGEGDMHYTNSFECIPASVPYRAPRVTPKPFVQGAQTAIITGPAGEEIHTDKYGRVKVQFHWDREGKHNENSSCWMRVSQPWAGKNWGAISIPRVGQEVLVDFLEGDPDQPIITGRVYHAENMPPHDLPGDKTVTAFKTNSSPGGKGFNELRFEDKKGSEQVFIHSQKRMDIRVRQSFFETNHANRHTIVGFADPETGNQGGDYNITVGNDVNFHIKGGLYERVEKKINESAGDAVVHSWEAAESTIVKAKKEINAKEVIVEALSKISFKVGPSFITLEPSGITIFGPMVKINSGGYGTETADADIEDPLDAALADDGTPGFVERQNKAAGKGGGRKKRKVRGQHYVAPPRPGEDPRMTAIRNKLANSATGRHALEVYDRFGVTPTFNSGGTAYRGGVVNMDPSRTDPATSFVHEMNHAQHDKEGTSADINNQTKADYVDQQLREDAEGERLAYQTQNELKDAGTPEPYNSITGTAYQNGYKSGRDAEKAKNPNATEAELDKAGHDAGEAAILQDYRNGNTTTGNTTPPQSYVNYWGSAYDSVHPPPATPPATPPPAPAGGASGH
jgi:type VI secretion system secreted protein VgrG